MRYCSSDSTYRSRLPRPRQRNRGLGSALGPIGCIDRAMVGGHEFGDDSEADATPRHVRGSVTAPEPLEQRNARVSRAPRGLSSRLPVTRDAESIAGAEHCPDKDGFVRIELDLAAQVLHVRVNGSLAPVELVTPETVDQLSP